MAKSIASGVGLTNAWLQLQGLLSLSRPSLSTTSCKHECIAWFCSCAFNTNRDKESFLLFGTLENQQSSVTVTGVFLRSNITNA